MMGAVFILAHGLFQLPRIVVLAKLGLIVAGVAARYVLLKA